MKLYIPEIGDTIKLTADWTFSVHYESRCKDLLDILKLSTNYVNSGYGKKAGDFTLPIDTELKIDRIYIRKGADDFSSISFVIVSTSDSRIKKKSRFWAKLADVNQIDYEVVGLKNPIDQKVIKIPGLYDHSRYSRHIYMSRENLPNYIYKNHNYLMKKSVLTVYVKDQILDSSVEDQTLVSSVLTIETHELYDPNIHIKEHTRNFMGFGSSYEFNPDTAQLAHSVHTVRCGSDLIAQDLKYESARKKIKEYFTILGFNVKFQ